VAAVRRDAHRCHIGVPADGSTGEDGFHEGKGRAKMEATGMRLLTRD